MTDTRGYYQDYWDDPNAAPPALDPTTPVRKELLAAALRDLPAHECWMSAAAAASSRVTWPIWDTM